MKNKRMVGLWTAGMVVSAGLTAAIVAGGNPSDSQSSAKIMGVNGGNPVALVVNSSDSTGPLSGDAVNTEEVTPLLSLEGGIDGWDDIDRHLKSLTPDQFEAEAARLLAYSQETKALYPNQPHRWAPTASDIERLAVEPGDHRAIVAVNADGLTEERIRSEAMTVVGEAANSMPIISAPGGVINTRCDTSSGDCTNGFASSESFVDQRTQVRVMLVVDRQNPSDVGVFVECGNVTLGEVRVTTPTPKPTGGAPLPSTTTVVTTTTTPTTETTTTTTTPPSTKTTETTPPTTTETTVTTPPSTTPPVTTPPSTTPPVTTPPTTPPTTTPPVTTPPITTPPVTTAKNPDEIHPGKPGHGGEGPGVGDEPASEPVAGEPPATYVPPAPPVVTEEPRLTEDIPPVETAAAETVTAPAAGEPVCDNAAVCGDVEDASVMEDESESSSYSTLDSSSSSESSASSGADETDNSNYGSGGSSSSGGMTADDADSDAVSSHSSDSDSSDSSFGSSLSSVDTSDSDSDVATAEIDLAASSESYNPMAIVLPIGVVVLVALVVAVFVRGRRNKSTRTWDDNQEL